MNKIQEISEYIWNIKILKAMIIIVISYILYKSIDYIIKKSEKNERSKVFASNRSKTYLKLIRSIVRNAFILVTFLIILQINGININSVLAGVGIVGVIFGLAIQDWLKDIIRGTNILSDNYFHVGDIVKYKDTEGKVIVIGLKTTKIQDLATKNVLAIANRNIDEIQVVSPIVHINIPMPYQVPVNAAEKAVMDIVKLIKHNDNVNNCKYIGVTELADSSIQYMLEIECNQQFKLQVRRDALRSVLVGLADNNIEVPFTQIDIHNK